MENLRKKKKHFFMCTDKTTFKNCLIYYYYYFFNIVNTCVMWFLVSFNKTKNSPTKIAVIIKIIRQKIQK